MFNKILIRTLAAGILIFSPLAMADFYCSQLDSVRQNLASCEKSESQAQADNTSLQDDKRNLEQALNNNDYEWDLRRCESDINSMQWDYERVSQDLQVLEQDNNDLARKVRRKRQRLISRIKGWECVLVGIKYGGTTYAKGLTRKEAFDKAQAKNGMFSKHGVWTDVKTGKKGFCNPVYK